LSGSTFHRLPTSARLHVNGWRTLRHLPLAARDAKLMYGIDVDKDAKVIHYYGQSEKPSWLTGVT